MTGKAKLKAKKAASKNESTNSTKEWTIMIYMSGENNLNTDMVYSMEKIRKSVNPNGKLNLFVYFDGATPDVPTLYCDFSDPKSTKQYYRSANINDPLYKPNHKKWRAYDENSAAMESLANFVDWCVNKVEHNPGKRKVRGRKAKRYALILSGHSLGFQNVGLFKDEESDYYMTLPKLRWMLNRLTGTRTELESMERDNARRRGYRCVKKSDRWIENTTPVLKKKLDILGFDSCVMGMLEVGYQFSSVAKTLIASEGSIPNAGWSYAEIFRCLSKNAEDSTDEVVKQFVSEFIATQDQNTLGGINVDMAAWNLANVPIVARSLGALGDALFDCFRKSKSTTYSLMRRLITYVHWSSQSYMLEQNVDLADFCSLLVDEIYSLEKEGLDLKKYTQIEKVKAAALSVIKAVEKAIIIHGFSGGKYQYSRGISIFFPWSLAAYKVSKEAYDDLFFVRYTPFGLSWRDFIDLFVGYVSLRESVLPGDPVRNGKAYYTYRYTTEGQPSTVSADGTRQPIIGKDRQPLIGKVKQPIIGKVKQPLIGKEKQPLIGKEKQPLIGKEKQPLIGKVKSPINPTQRLPENASARIAGADADFFDQFTDTNNIQTFWNISGISDSKVYQQRQTGQTVIVNFNPDLNFVKVS
jgi:hypothetical protein